MAKNRKKGPKSRDDHEKGAKEQEITAQNAALKSPPPKPKTAAERKRTQIDGIKKTVYPSALGVGAGFVCFYGPEIINQLPWHTVIIIIIGITYFIQKATYPFMGINPSEFKSKDWFYVEFMAIDLWLVTWTLLLN